MTFRMTFRITLELVWEKAGKMQEKDDTDKREKMRPWYLWNGKWNGNAFKIIAEITEGSWAEIAQVSKLE